MRRKGAHDRRSATYVAAICLFQPAEHIVLDSHGGRAAVVDFQATAHEVYLYQPTTTIGQALWQLRSVGHFRGPT